MARRGDGLDFAGAEKKIRQARFFLDELDVASKRPMRGADDGNEESLEFYFSASLTAAKSAYDILRDTGGVTFESAEAAWQRHLGEPAQSEFDSMKKLRNKDVHVAVRPGTARTKYVAEAPSRYSTTFGPTADFAQTNPDGAVVRAPVLRAARGLYVTRGTRTIEATGAGREFIEQLCSLLQAVRASGSAAPSPGPDPGEDQRQ